MRHILLDMYPCRTDYVAVDLSSLAGPLRHCSALEKIEVRVQKRVFPEKEAFLATVPEMYRDKVSFTTKNLT